MAADSRVRRGLRLTSHQELHERLMWAVLERVRDLDMVLKGSTALAFTRGLNRHSTDLDFDSERPVELRDRIDSAAQALGVNLGHVERKDRPKDEGWYLTNSELEEIASNSRRSRTRIEAPQ